MATKCNVDNVPDKVLDDQLKHLDRIRRKCQDEGGKLSTRAYFGCDDLPLSEYKGKSNEIAYSPDDGEFRITDDPLDLLPDVNGNYKSREQLDKIIEERRRQAIKKELQNALDSAKNKPNCGDANPAFIMRSACKKGGVNIVDPNNSTPFKIY
jgi:hypothetical protein